MIDIKVKKIDDSVDLPTYETSSSVGMDIRAFLPNGNVDIAPAMNKEMWANPIIQNNVDYLKKICHQFIGPDDGSLACGEYGSGRLVDPGEILNQLK